MATAAGCKCGCPIELFPTRLEHEGAYLFVDDDGRILRFRLDADRIRIGRDTANDIWIDNPAVRPHTLLVYKKDDEYCIKVYDGAKVLLNGVPVTGMHRLYSGDRIGVADREFLYGRDDSPPEIAVGLTVLVEGVVSHAVTFRRTRVRIGRRDADLVLNDASVSDKHLMLECYSAEGLYACDLGSASGTFLKGERIEERSKLTDGCVVQVGRIQIRVHMLPTDAHGLLLSAGLPDQPKVPIAAPMPMDRSSGQRHDPSAQRTRARNADQQPVSGGFIRPLHAANASSMAVHQRPPPEPPPSELPGPERQPGQALVPVTAIGSLQQLMMRGQHMQTEADLAARGTPEPPPPSDHHGRAYQGQRAQEEPRGQAASHASGSPIGRAPPGATGPRDDDPRNRGQSEDRVPDAAFRRRAQGHDDRQTLPPERHPDDRPAVRVKPEVLRQGEAQSRGPAWADASSQRENLRVRPRESPGADMVPVSVAPSGLHHQVTNVLDTDAVRARVRGHADWVQAEAEAQFSRRASDQPLTQAFDTLEGKHRPAAQGRYRLSKKGADDAWVDEWDPGSQPPPLPLAQRSSEAERRANPEYGNDRPEPLPVQASSYVDPSARPPKVRIVDRSQRLDDDGPTGQPSKAK